MRKPRLGGQRAADQAQGKVAGLISGLRVTQTMHIQELDPSQNLEYFFFKDRQQWTQRDLHSCSSGLCKVA